MRLQIRLRALSFFATSLLACSNGATGADSGANDASGGDALAPVDAGADSITTLDASDGSLVDVVDAPVDAPPEVSDGASDSPTDALDADDAGDAAPSCAGNSVGGTAAVKGPSASQTDADQTFRSLTVSLTNSDVVFVGSEGNGIFRSTNGGSQWTWLRSGLRTWGLAGSERYAEVWDMAFDPTNANTIYAATNDAAGPTIGNYPSAIGGIYKSVDQGTTWAQVNCGFDSARAQAVMVDSAGAVYASFGAGAPTFFPAPPKNFYDGGIYKSTDGGISWKKESAPSGFEKTSIWHLANKGGYQFAFGLVGETGLLGPGLAVRPAGQAWALSQTPLNGVTIAHFAVASDGINLFAVEQNAGTLRKSINRGSTWTSLTGNQFNGPIAVHPVQQSNILFASQEKLYKSTDGLATSTGTLVLTAPAAIEEIAYAPSNPLTIYVSTRGLRVFKSTNGGDSFVEIVNLRATLVGP